MSSSADIYRQAILAQIPRVLGLMDREPFSGTRGSFDRTFWAWKFTDFPGARFQEGLCLLSFLYANDFPGNCYFGQPKLRGWIEAGLGYWADIQRPGGDFDEAYPWERSLAATAFTAYYLGEAWTWMQDDFSGPTADRFCESIARAGHWLCRNDETHGFLSNHRSAAAAALLQAHRITGIDLFRDASHELVKGILARQSEEGWYEEYGGADPGYQTHGSFYLARILELAPDERLRDSLDRSCRFLAHFIHPDRSIGGEYASRSTQTYYPAAFEMLKTVSGSASWIAREMLPAVEGLLAAGAASVDVYNLFPLLNNYVFAYLGSIRNQDVSAPPDEPDPASGTHYFPHSGILKIRRERYDLIVGLSKGGVIKLFDRQSRSLAYSHCGYVGRLRGGSAVSTQTLLPDRPVYVGEDSIRVTGPLFDVSRPAMTPARFVAFRLFSLGLGRFNRLARWLKEILVRALISRHRPLTLEFERRILLHLDGIEIVDRLSGRDGVRVEALEPAENFSTIHMGSARYFVPHELATTMDPTHPFHFPIPVEDLTTGVERDIRVRLGERSSG